MWALIKSRVCFSAVNRLIQHYRLLASERRQAPARVRLCAFMFLFRPYFYLLIFIIGFRRLFAFAQRSTVRKRNTSAWIQFPAKIQNTQTLRFFWFFIPLMFCCFCFLLFVNCSLWAYESVWISNIDFGLCFDCKFFWFQIPKKKSEKHRWKKRDNHDSSSVQIWYENYLYSMQYCLVAFVAEIVYLCWVAPYRQVSQQQHVHTHTTERV